MSTTVQNAIDQARIGYPSIPDVGAPSTAVNLFNEVHNDILTRCGIQTDTETITLVAGTKEYALMTTARFASTVMYVRSANAGDVVKLLSRSQEEFENELPAYRYEDRGEPNSYYINHGNDGTVSIGFDPTPDTATTGGYPSVVLRVGRGAVLTAVGVLPLGVARHSAWVAGLQAFWAKRRNLPEANQKMAEYEEEVSKLQVWRHEFQQESPFQAVPNNSWKRRKRV
jgi:hypothetical protein